MAPHRLLTAKMASRSDRLSPRWKNTMMQLHGSSKSVASSFAAYGAENDVTHTHTAPLDAVFDSIETNTIIFSLCLLPLNLNTVQVSGQVQQSLRGRSVLSFFEKSNKNLSVATRSYRSLYLNLTGVMHSATCDRTFNNSSREFPWRQEH